jgi:transcription-repair coupling factor (superfamily II helicase)
MPQKMLSERCVSLKVGDEVLQSELIKSLLNLGFLRVELVESAGQFSQRGGIVDIWSSLDTDPVRIEFFGDEIDRIVYFDPITQRSLTNAESIFLIPASEVIVNKDARARIAAAIEKQISLTDSEEIVSKLKNELGVVTSDLPINFRDKYIGLIYTEFANLFSYISSDCRSPVFIIDTNGVREEMQRGL